MNGSREEAGTEVFVGVMMRPLRQDNTFLVESDYEGEKGNISGCFFS